MTKIFYRMDLNPTENGLHIWTKKFLSIHETPCFHFCVSDYDFKFLTTLDEAKSTKTKIYRIHKVGSRIAFETEQLAFENLRYRKTRQVLHLTRELEFAKSFLSATEDLKFDALPEDFVVPNTYTLVNRFYRFD